MRTDKLSDSEVLTTCITRAIENGWTPPYLDTPAVAGISFSDYKTRIRFGSIVGGETLAIEEVIFDHSFARSLWGDEWKTAEILDRIPETDTYRIGTINPSWQFHLQALVVAPDRIQYLREWLQENPS